MNESLDDIYKQLREYIKCPNHVYKSCQTNWIVVLKKMFDLCG